VADRTLAFRRPRFKKKEMKHDLGGGHYFITDTLPAELLLDTKAFDALWSLHPSDYHEIKIHGREVKTPRWQQAYGEDYAYTGRVNRALPVPESLMPLLAFTKREIDPRLNGILLNWYDAKNAHYIGKHRDSTKNMIEGAPIVTVSYGSARIFRLRPWKGEGFVDFPAVDGALFVMPYETNLAFTHEVPHNASSKGRRISVTVRAFESSV
jgi:alkylated DNA repair dioxygenase AlkB